MPKPIVLTRYLYIRDEVEIALINALISKADFEEVLFWLSELYESGFREEAWNLLWRCFYDFYAVKNSQQEAMYLRHYEEWRIDKMVSHLIFMCKNMHIKSADPSVFLFRMKVECDPLPKKTAITGRRPKWVSEYDHEAQPFLVSLDKNMNDNILYYFKTLPVEILRINLCRYFKEKYEVDMSFDKIDSVWNGTRYDRRHILMAIYHSMMMDETEVNSGKMFVSVDNDEISYWRGIDVIEDDIPSYRVLHYKREYGIPKMVGSFNLARYFIKQTDGFTDLNKILWYHWEYFAYRCPLWRKRIIEHSGEAVDEKKRVGFSRYYDDTEENIKAVAAAMAMAAAAARGINVSSNGTSMSVSTSSRNNRIEDDDDNDDDDDDGVIAESVASGAGGGGKEVGQSSNKQKVAENELFNIKALSEALANSNREMASNTKRDPIEEVGAIAANRLITSTAAALAANQGNVDPIAVATAAAAAALASALGRSVDGVASASAQSGGGGGGGGGASSSNDGENPETPSATSDNDNIGVEELRKNIKLAREKNYRYCIETFYELYGFEPDEQSVEVQDKVRGEGGSIEPVSLTSWLETVFDKERLGGFTDSVGVRYDYIGISM